MTGTRAQDIIDVCICTYRRVSIVDTLKSIEAQQLPEGFVLRVIVADNDDTPSAQARVEATAAQMKFVVKYLHAPSRNISIARNACLDAASGTWVAFIDDDETASADWLAQLLTCAHTQHLDAVFGPTRASYGADTPRWMRERDYHSNIPRRRDGEVHTGHTCNALLRREHPLVANQRFLLEKGRSGGEDTEFFYRLWHAGLRLGICDEALVHETVDPARLAWRWIARRKFRSGQTYSLLSSRDATLAARTQRMLLAVLKVQFCLALVVLNLGFETRRNYWLLRSVFHSGVFAGCARIPERELY